MRMLENTEKSSLAVDLLLISASAVELFLNVLNYISGKINNFSVAFNKIPQTSSPPTANKRRELHHCVILINTHFQWPNVHELSPTNPKHTQHKIGRAHV